MDFLNEKSSQFLVALLISKMKVANATNIPIAKNIWEVYMVLSFIAPRPSCGGLGGVRALVERCSVIQKLSIH